MQTMKKSKQKRVAAAQRLAADLNTLLAFKLAEANMPFSERRVSGDIPEPQGTSSDKV